MLGNPLEDGKYVDLLMDDNEELLDYIGKCNHSYLIWYVSTEKLKAFALWYTN